MNQSAAQRLKRTEWVLGGVTLATALVVWWQIRQPQSGLDLYEFFPLLGLVAFGLMWTHFISGALAQYWRLESGSELYRRVSMLVVLACIVAHPVLLWIVLWRDDFGWPPISQYVAYGVNAMATAALFVGMVALTIFLAYELHRWFSEKRWWKYIEWLQLPAMLLIFYHALTLGGELDVIWYQALWWLYGVSLVAAVVYVYTNQRRKRV